MSQYYISILKSKFITDSLFNIVSVFILGVCGLLLNFIIARKYSAQALGVFNEVYAFYIIFSQFAALGVQVSSLKHTAQYSGDIEVCKQIFTAAFIVVAISASLFSIVLLLVRAKIAVFFASPGVATGIMWIIPGLWFFSLNKLYLNVLNGFRRMKAYAMFTSFRYLAMLITLVISVQIALDSEKITVIFSISEFLLFVLLTIYCRKSHSFSRLDQIWHWIKKHLSFGLKSMIGGVTADLNTRIDVIILGYFTSDGLVGIYSFAATIVEGIAQIPYIFKQNIDPVLTKLVCEKRFDELNAMIKNGRKWMFWGMLALGVLLMSFYLPAIKLITGKADFLQSWPIFCILITGVIIQAGYMPFSGILVQSGFPFLQTLHLVSFTLTNICLNMIFVPLWGIYGSALATALAFIVFIVYLKLFTYHALKIEI